MASSDEIIAAIDKAIRRAVDQELSPTFDGARRARAARADMLALIAPEPPPALVEAGDYWIQELANGDAKIVRQNGQGEVVPTPYVRRDQRELVARSLRPEPPPAPRTLDEALDQLATVASDCRNSHAPFVEVGRAYQNAVRANVDAWVETVAPDAPREAGE